MLPYSLLHYSQDRELNDDWIAAASAWIEEAGEAFMSIRYLYNSPTMKFALLRSPGELLEVIRACPGGAELTLWNGARLAVRGALTPTLIEQARSSIPDGSECVCVFTASGSETDPRLEGDSWRSVSDMLAELKSELDEHLGKPVALGAWPEPKKMCAVKGGLEGPR
jgi:hypothetical protein